MQLLSLGLASDIAISKNLLHHRSNDACPPHLTSKQKEYIRHAPQSHASKSLELIYSCMGGPLPISIGCSRYFIIFVDDFSLMTWISFIPTKSVIEAFKAWIEFKRYISPSNSNQITRFRSDNGTEFHNHKMQDDFRTLSIIWEPSAAYS